MTNQQIIEREIEKLRQKIQMLTKTIKDFANLSERELDEMNAVANILLDRNISNRELLTLYTHELEREQEKYTWLQSQYLAMISQQLTTKVASL